MVSREIITLQVGHYSNFVGTHWWNIQESGFVYNARAAGQLREINHDVLFREGENRKGDVTFTPRLVAFDLKGSLNTLKQEGTLYDVSQEDDDIKWSGDVTMHTEGGAQKNSFLKQLDKEDGLEDKDDVEEENKSHSEKPDISDKQPVQQIPGSSVDIIFGPQLYHLDDTVKVWSDYLRPHLHPKSVQIIEEYRHENELKPFDLYGCGEQLMKDYTFTCEWEDRLHFFVEECDSLQGFHMLMDTRNGFGGLGTSLLNYLEEEFTGKGILTFGFTPTDAPDKTAAERCTRIINSALAYNKICTHSSLFVPCSLAEGLWRKMEPPVNFPHLSYKPISYHTSAVLAGALDTLSLPYRLDTNPIHLRDITHSMNTQSRKMAALSLTLPLPISSDMGLVDICVKHQQTYPWTSLTPHIKNEAVPLMQSVVLRGIPNECVKSRQPVSSLPRHLASCDNVENVLEAYLEQRCPGTLSARTVIRDTCRTSLPFPHIFSKSVGKHGLLSQTERPPNQGVESIPMVTSLQSTPEVTDLLDHLHSAAVKMNIKKHHQYLELGLEEDEYAEILNSLKTLGGNYRPSSEAL